ncbi:hypothetical protein Vi05172_g5786 [Venturia inaequalis]|uniref:Uncharacterized protein n=1 Tax=Venturia inaequalis TaxID=5025 RepID=A0A8H3ZFW5_VENIN|nr:hypothetical protein EG327_011099 [Venturia inaequalis]RDI84481.1 hypothetical protein Vi05172_g5786 [Venturia inaequalis]
MALSNAASSADPSPALNPVAPSFEYQMRSEPIKTASPPHTYSNKSGYKEENKTNGSLADDENVKEPPTSFFNSLDSTSDGEEEPKVTDKQNHASTFGGNNIPPESSAPVYTRPIQELVANSKPDFTHQWVPWTNSYSDVPTMPWNQASPYTSPTAPVGSAASQLQSCECVISNRMCDSCVVRARWMASYVCPEEARRFASVTEAERQEQRRREREIDEDLFGMILGKYNDRETYFASYD